MGEEAASREAPTFEANGVTVFSVSGSGLKKVDEVPVGREPVCVAVSGNKAFVTSAASGTVSVLSGQGNTFFDGM